MFAFLAVVLLVGLAYGWCWPAARRERLVRGYAAQRWLVLDPEASRSAERLLVAVRRGRSLAATAVVVLTYPILARAGALDYRVSVGCLVAVSVGVQIAAAAGGAIAMHRAARLPSSRRVAHLSSLGLDDFLPPLLRWWSTAVLVVSAAAVVAALVVRPADPILRGRELVIAWIAALGVVVATEVASGMLLRTPQQAASPAELAVRDEIKSDLLAVVASGALGPALVVVAVAADFLPEAGWPTGIATILPLAALESRRRRHVRERLWETEPPTAIGRPAAR